jgi:hypothetical protein
MCDNKKPCPGHENHLCELIKEDLPKQDPVRYNGLVRDPQFVCKSCSRVAGKKENLCNPVELGTFE